MAMGNQQWKERCLLPCFHEARQTWQRLIPHKCGRQNRRDPDLGHQNQYTAMTIQLVTIYYELIVKDILLPIHLSTDVWWLLAILFLFLECKGGMVVKIHQQTWEITADSHPSSRYASIRQAPLKASNALRLKAHSQPPVKHADKWGVISFWMVLDGIRDRMLYLRFT